MHDQSVAQLQRPVDQRRRLVTARAARVRQREIDTPLSRASAAQPELVEPRALAHAHAENCAAKFPPIGRRIALRHVVERLGAVDDQAGENIEPAGRAFRIGGARDAGGKARRSISGAI